MTDATSTSDANCEPEFDNCGLSDDDFLSVIGESSVPGVLDSGHLLPKVYPNTPPKRREDVLRSIESLSPCSSASSPSSTSSAFSPRTLSPLTSKKDIFKVRNKRLRREGTPLQVYRYGRVWVSDIMSQLWCEQQLVYRFDPPPELRNVTIVEAPEVTTGVNMHLARELEFQDVVTVRVTSAEDRLALKVVNLMEALRSMLQLGTQMRREIPVFGAPFGMGVFVIGTIDELRCDHQTLQLDLVEFKTRVTKALPSHAQKMTHDLQVMLYKLLLDDMIRGALSKHDIATHMRLDLRKPFGNEMLEHLFLHDQQAMTLDLLLDSLFDLLASVPYASDTLTVQYVYQEDGSSIGETSVQYDQAWLRQELTQAFRFWNGERPAKGVDIEDLWKCDRCPYNGACAWQKVKAKEFDDERAAAERENAALKGSGVVMSVPFETVSTSVEKTGLTETETVIPPTIEISKAVSESSVQSGVE